MVELHRCFCELESLTNLFALEKLQIEDSGEIYGCFIFDVIISLDTDSVIYPKALEHLTNKLGCAGSKEDKVDLTTFFGYEIVQLILCNLLSFTRSTFEEEGLNHIIRALHSFLEWITWLLFDESMA